MDAASLSPRRVKHNHTAGRLTVIALFVHAAIHTGPQEGSPFAGKTRLSGRSKSSGIFMGKRRSDETKGARLHLSFSERQEADLTHRDDEEK